LFVFHQWITERSRGAVLETVMMFASRRASVFSLSRITSTRSEQLPELVPPRTNRAYPRRHAASPCLEVENVHLRGEDRPKDEVCHVKPWASPLTMQTTYQQSDAVTLVEVVTEPRRLRVAK
jgi:hypothetical protein